MIFKRNSLVHQKDIPELQYRYLGVVTEPYIHSSHPAILYNEKTDKYLVIPEDDLVEVKSEK